MQLKVFQSLRVICACACKMKNLFDAVDKFPEMLPVVQVESDFLQTVKAKNKSVEVNLSTDGTFRVLSDKLRGL